MGDLATMDRRSAALACRRLRGSHTFDVLAGALEDVHRQYGIIRKVAVTTTDNGSDFVKALAVFGRQEGGDDADGSSDADADDDAAVFTEVQHVLAEDDGSEFHLPRHHRCACHTLQLEGDAAYKRISRAAFGKCQGHWNKAGRSVMSSEALLDTFGLALIRPNQKRWNSVFDAVERLARIANDRGEDALHTVCNQLNVPR